MKIKFHPWLIMPLLFLGISISCQKNSTTFGENKREESRNYLVESKSNFTNETIDLATFVRSYDTVILKSFSIIPIIDDNDNPAPIDSSGNIQYMEAKNLELKNILVAINPIAYSGADTQDPLLVISGILEMYFQLTSGQTPEANMHFPWQCIRDVIGGVLSGAAIIASYQNIVASGASWSTVRAFLWQALRKYGGWFTAATALYRIAKTCF